MSTAAGTGLETQIRERVDAQTAALRDALARADAATRAKDEFLANLSHEVRTPLNAIIGLIGLLQKTSLSEDQRSYVELLGSSSSALLGLVNDVLDFGKIEAGKLVLEQVRFSLPQWLDETAMPYALQAKQKGVDVHIDLDPALPVQVTGDPGRLRQVLSNLLSNAVKFTPRGSIDIELVRLKRPGGAVEGQLDLGVRVRDTGVGMTPAEQAHIFDAFTQADASTTRRFGGTGLGLAICQRLVKAMNGKLWVESVKGQGSDFRFRIALREATAQDAPMTMPATLMYSVWVDLKVLVAEDNAVNQLLMRKILGSTGCKLTMVGNGQEALAAWRQSAPDVVLMDIQMPVMDGFEATAAIRLEEAGRCAPSKIVALTAHAMPGDQERCLAAGMDAYVTKPVSMEALTDVLHDLLGRPSANQGL